MSPFWYLTVPSEEVARRICERTMLIKHMIDLWGEASTFEELQAAIQACPAHKRAPWGRAGTSFKIVVDGWGNRIEMPEQVKLIERLAFLHLQVGFPGRVPGAWEGGALEPGAGYLGPGSAWAPGNARVDLKNPDVTFRLVVLDNDSVDNGLPHTVHKRWYFGREVASSKRGLINQYALTRRRYLGPTSMDTEMAFIICNQAQVRKGSLVYDPFVGTGSILVAAGHLGAYTLGADIDIRVIRDGKEDKRGERVDVWANFRDYRLQPPVGLIRADAHRPPWRDDLQEVLDAVICDPPYGVRAGGRKSVKDDSVVVDDRSKHIVTTDPYPMGECVRDLLDTSARLLRCGGRLVFFFPASPETYSEEELPAHPALRLLANSEQPLTSRYSRRLLTMAKVKPYCAAEAARFHEEHKDTELLVDQLSALIFEPRRDNEGNLVDRVSNKKKWRGKAV
ncbi:hypothetical protein WJX72_005797 [[Myrmecia] bisecta]|uniref:tRNA (guanine(10)-N(2))-methyltransferase n=1 Tax=[Myrmecia] bisecta TaxID=41462 RepID=A0AAW1PSV7_9CHLO